MSRSISGAEHGGLLQFSTRRAGARPAHVQFAGISAKSHRMCRSYRATGLGRSGLQFGAPKRKSPCHLRGGRRARTAERLQRLLRPILYKRPPKAPAAPNRILRPKGRPTGSGAPRTTGPICRPPRGPSASARPCPISHSISVVASRNPSSRRSAITAVRNLVSRDQGGGQLQADRHGVVGVEQVRPCPPASRGCKPAAGPSRASSVGCRSPTTRADLPRISSSTSGFFLCGMMLEPVQNASGRSRKLNSVVDQIIHSSAQPLRCSGDQRQVEDEFEQRNRGRWRHRGCWRRSRRSRVAARTNSRSIGSDVPASAAAPSGRTLTRLRQSASRSRSRWYFST